MRDKAIQVDLTVERIEYLRISRDPAQHDGIGMLLTALIGDDGDSPVIIGFSKEATRMLYEALLENPPPANKTLMPRH